MVKDTERFQQTLDRKTLEFLEKWYNLPIQQILRVLASVDVQGKRDVDAEYAKMLVDQKGLNGKSRLKWEPENSVMKTQKEAQK